MKRKVKIMKVNKELNSKITKMVSNVYSFIERGTSITDTITAINRELTKLGIVLENKDIRTEIERSVNIFDAPKRIIKLIESK